MEGLLGELGAGPAMHDQVGLSALLGDRRDAGARLEIRRLLKAFTVRSERSDHAALCECGSAREGSKDELVFVSLDRVFDCFVVSINGFG